MQFSPNAMPRECLMSLLSECSPFRCHSGEVEAVRLNVRCICAIGGACFEDREKVKESESCTKTSTGSQDSRMTCRIDHNVISHWTTLPAEPASHYAVYATELARCYRLTLNLKIARFRCKSTRENEKWRLKYLKFFKVSNA